MFVDEKARGEPFEWPEKVPSPNWLDAPAIGFVALLYLIAGVIFAISYSGYLGAAFVFAGLIAALTALVHLGEWMETI